MKLSDIEKSTDINKTRFYFNNIMDCNHCQDKEDCPVFTEFSKKNKNFSTMCPFETSIYESIMKSLESEYNVTEMIRILAESVVGDIILTNRVDRYIKLRGLKEKAFIKNEAGEVLEVDRENLLKSGLHLDKNRILRFVKEMKLTPKEKNPKEMNVNYNFKQEIVKRLEKAIINKKEDELDVE